MKNFKKINKPVTRGQRGFNLIEVLVAMLLISIVLFSICSLLVYSSGTMGKTRGQTESTVRLYGLAELVNALSGESVLNTNGSAGYSPISKLIGSKGMVIHSNSDCSGIEIYNLSPAYETKAKDFIGVIDAWYKAAINSDKGQMVSFFAVISKSNLRNADGDTLKSVSSSESNGPYVADMTLFRFPSGTEIGKNNDGCIYINANEEDTLKKVSELKNQIASSVIERAEGADSQHLSEGTYSNVTVMLGH